MKAINSLENFICYGFINKNTFKSLLLKRGYLRNEKKIFSIKSNKVVEDAMGALGIICVEDIVSEIFSSKYDEKLYEKIMK